jgi:hypothetical protein
LGERAATVLVDVSAANLMDLADALHCPTFPES